MSNFQLQLFDTLLAHVLVYMSFAFDICYSILLVSSLPFSCHPLQIQEKGSTLSSDSISRETPPLFDCSRAETHEYLELELQKDRYERFVL